LIHGFRKVEEKIKEAVDLTKVYLENALKQCVCVLLLPIVQIS